MHEVIFYYKNNLRIISIYNFKQKKTQLINAPTHITSVRIVHIQYIWAKIIYIL